MSRTVRVLLMPLLIAAGAALLLAQPAHADDGVTYAGPELCKVCHPAQAEDWQHAPHADASKVAAFVEEWQALNSPNYCLECHTTGYDPNTGQYALEGVTCEACHGPFSPEHPQKPMQVDTAPEACGRCHKSTFNEWEISQHGKSGIACATCHDVHGSTVKTGDASTLCVKCHAEQASNVAHASSTGKGLTCSDCHIGPLTGDPAEGHANTGHTFAVGTGTCSRCHAEEVHRGVSLMMGSTDPEAETEPVATETPAAPAVEPETAPRTAGVALPVVAGGAIGLVLGIGWSRWQSRKA